MKSIQSALISVFNKKGLEPIVKFLYKEGVKIYSTGGTQSFIEKLDIPVTPVESLTQYPSIFGGRVKTLHPVIFGGILYRRDNNSDLSEAQEYKIPAIDLIIVDLYPFEETVASGKSEEDIIEKIDIGGVSLIRAAAKNFKDTLIVSNRNQYADVLEVLQKNGCASDLNIRKQYAAEAFEVTRHYDTAIHHWFLDEKDSDFKNFEVLPKKELRYGENPHQKATFYGDFDAMFEQLHGKQISYNNLVDIDACVNLIDEFDKKQATYAIIKHTNACGLATGENAKEAYLRALAGDPVSAFGGVIITNSNVDLAVAEELNKLFMEILIAPSYDINALELLSSKKNRILLVRKETRQPKETFKTILNGVLMQDKDLSIESKANMKSVTKRVPNVEEYVALEFALKVCKHTKSNTIVLAKGNQLIASGVGQTSRVDALRQAIEKAKNFGFDLKGAVMASDAFFPFPDCVEISHQEGIDTVVQPGGSIKDQLSIDYCDANNMSMVFTGVRHFLH
ncbi:MAG: bifunctional phosphoribosylaminoimidazolecarboxamide formyltransferase/IMP cyclohydrolase [Chitinophagales bacterium]|nr:bifunctional phosphoribosylaminoimidazolecarboxamide formyltransferase/IMP cyclohydrolase [Chitinophagales bacterium]